MGAILGFLLIDGAAVVFGSWIAHAVPEKTIRYGSAAIFIIFGALMLKSGSGERSIRVFSGSPFTAAFLLITFTEFGDKTQLAAALFAAKYNPALVLAGAMTALTALSAAAIWLGHKLADKINPQKAGEIAGITFITIGAATLLL